MKKLKTILYSILTLILTYGCVENFTPENITYEDILVIDGTLTNEVKKHTIKLSRTYQIDSTIVKPEKGASVYIIDSDNTTYSFQEIEEGTYESLDSFSAIPSKDYILKIETKNGIKYSSSKETLTPEAELKEINYTTEKNNFNEDIVTITVNSSSINENAKYYRFQYEETYKILPPYRTPIEFEIISDTPPVNFKKVLKNYEDQECYKTEKSTAIILTETSSLSNNEILNFSIRSINTSDFILSNRYSILIKQYSQNINAYNYYQTLKKFSSTENVFSQSQTGFLRGNITSENNQNEKTIGYFEVCSVSSKRIFLNRIDVIDTIPDFINNCNFLAPLAWDPLANNSPLAYALRNGYVFFDDNNTGSEHLEGPYLLVRKICSDCRVLGSNIKPDFWID